jgi:hypothetical protein
LLSFNKEACLVGMAHSTQFLFFVNGF